jgi:aminopeptidase N
MKPNLTQKQAEERAKKVEFGTKNEIFIKLEKGESYSGIGRYCFRLNDTEGVFLDYSGKSVDHLNINGIEISGKQICDLRKDCALFLPPEHLKKDSYNVVRIYFSNTYARDGNGLQSFVDVDKKQYLYCQTEPFYANKIYPVFDQPDLKGTMIFIIQAPKDWQVVSNSFLDKVLTVQEFLDPHRPKDDFEDQISYLHGCVMEESADETLVSKFKMTPVLSSYLYTFCAGPFELIPSEKRKVPMTIYCRSTLKEFAEKQKESIFIFVDRGIEFYEEFFQTKFPFEKFDLIFCPEFTVGAMEFPGAVTFNDNMIFREVPNMWQITRRGKTILHELAHFWFGDLVTMKWWNDLWLNESFADFTCYLALDHMNRNEKNTPTVDAFTSFQARKWNGYLEDSEALTTHPIASIVDSTDKAEAIFDGITYSKGAAVLMQLYYLITPKVFSKFLKNYFEKFAFKNATLADFLEEIKKVLEEKQEGPFDMENFKKTWIELAGHNQLSVSWDPAQQGKSKIVITQTPVLSDFKTLHYHKLSIGLFKNNGDEIKVFEQKLVNNVEKTEIEFENEKFEAVNVNYKDNAFVRLEFDKQSLEFFKKLLKTKKDGELLTRLQVFRALDDSIRDGKSKGEDFIKLMLDGTLKNTAYSTLLFESVGDIVNTSLNVFTPEKNRGEMNQQVLTTLVSFLTENKAQEYINSIKKKLFDFSNSYQGVKLLKEINENNSDLYKHINFSFSEQWHILFKMYGIPEFSDLQRKILRDFLEEEDKSDSKKYWLMSIDALTADDAKAKDLWAQLALVPKKLSFTEMDAILFGLNSRYRPVEKRNAFNSFYFGELVNLIKKDQKKNVVSFFNGGLPLTENFSELITTLKKTVLSNLTNEHEFFIILIKKKISLLERREKAYKLYG